MGRRARRAARRAARPGERSARALLIVVGRISRCQLADRLLPEQPPTRCALESCGEALATDDIRAAAPSERRPELDGLRAIAIALVLLGHFDLAPFGGGFAGVDIFFVLSGFLITVQCADAGDALPWRRIGGFYVRRFWRIAPAYLAVVAATAFIGVHIVLADDARRLETSAAASALFAANLFFNNDLGYFAPSAIYSPLLHLWSLGVEAQFYLIWPLVIRLVLSRTTAKRLAIIGAIGAVSFALSTVLSFTDAKTAFFSLPSRLWEFGAGGALALAPQFAARVAQWRRASHLAAAALVVLLVAPFLFDGDSVWPAPLAAIVVAPTAALIVFARSPGGVAYRLLSLAPLTWFGRISYSLYLVHWPLVTLATYSVFPAAAPALRLALLAASIAAGWALNAVVENPLRFGYRSLTLRRWAAVGAAAAITLGAASWLAVPAATATPTVAGETKNSAVACRPPLDWHGKLGDACLLGGGEALPVAALWGDSHAGQFDEGFDHAFAAKDETVAGFFRPSCPPLPGLRVSTNLFNAHRDCEKHNAQTLAFLVTSPSIKTVFLAARWAAYADARRFGRETGGRYYLVDDDHRFPSIATSRLLLRDRLIAVAQTLLAAGKTVVLIEPTPEMGFDAGRCVRLLDPAAAAERCVVPRAAVVERRSEANAAIAAAREAVPQLRLFDPLPRLCDETLCYAVRDGVALYSDFHHLSAAGADRLVPDLLRRAQAD
ncbi:MAG: acyltransferase [Bradyrhizobium sp.]|nr:MAG: acyltransferase [Bradyrhizobium sp.]